jgi:hypothetical protein
MREPIFTVGERAACHHLISPHMQGTGNSGTPSQDETDRDEPEVL